MNVSGSARGPEDGTPSSAPAPREKKQTARKSVPANVIIDTSRRITTSFVPPSFRHMLNNMRNRDSPPVNRHSGPVHRRSSPVKVNRRSKKIPQRRQKYGVGVLQEIYRLQNSVNTVIPRASFQRLCRQTCKELHDKGDIVIGPTQLRFQFGALESLQEAAENYMTSYFDDVNLVAAHCGRVTIKLKDMHFVSRIRNPHS